MFEKLGTTIRFARGVGHAGQRPQSFTIFQDDDDGFLDWVEAHPDGYIINADRNPKPSFLVLHNSPCRHIDGTQGVERTKNFVKVCSDDRNELEEWAVNTVGGEVTLCRTCFG